MTAAPSEPLRLALIGAGGIGAEHAEAIAQSAEFELAAVVDTNVARAQQLAQGTSRTYSNVDDMFSGESDLHGVVVATNSASHVPLGLRAIDEGCPVMLEKPASLTVEGAHVLRKAAQRVNARVLIGQTVRFQPAYSSLLANTRSGAVGTPRMAHVSFLQGSIWKGAWRANQLNVALSGPHYLHNGVHPIDLCVALIDDVPVRVMCRPVNTWARTQPTPDTFHVQIGFRSGKVGVVELSYGLRDVGRQVRRVTVAGTHGTLTVDSSDELTQYGPRRVQLLSTANAFTAQYAHFADVIRGAEPDVTLDQMVSVIQIASAAAHSAESGRVAQIGDGDA